jgi:hypothetical protein
MKSPIDGPAFHPLALSPDLDPAVRAILARAWLPGSRSSHLTRRWREPGSNLYEAFRVKWLFLVLLPVLCSEREKPFFVPSPGIRFAERAEGVKGPNASIAWRLAA